MTTTCWVSMSDDKTAVPVGTEAIAFQSENIIALIDRTTLTKKFYNVENNDKAAGIAVLAGHERYGLFAYAESKLQPAIHVVRYPELSELVSFESPTVTTYVDLVLSQYGLLIALTGYPNYTLRVYNFRLAVFYTEVNTGIKSARYSLICSSANLPTIVQYSQFVRNLTIWTLCLTTDVYELHQVSQVSMSEEFAESSLFSVCYAEDKNVYCVNDYGVVSLVDIGQFYLRRKWETPKNIQYVAKPRAHSIYGNKLGLVVTNEEMLYFLKKRNEEWSLEWQLETRPTPFIKVVTNNNFPDMFAVLRYGNVSSIERGEDGLTPKLTEIIGYNCCVVEYVIVKGVKEENVLMLTKDATLRMVDCLRMTLHSEMKVEKATAIGAHPTLPLVAVGTQHGSVHILSYEKIRAVEELAVIELEAGKIVEIWLSEQRSLVKDEYNHFHILICDPKEDEFRVVISLHKEWQNDLINFYLLDNNRAIFFNAADKNKGYDRYCKQAWLYEWATYDARVTIQMFDLPYNYWSFEMPAIVHLSEIEIYGMRANDFVIDIYVLKGKTLCLETSIGTLHTCVLSGMSGSRNLITWSIDGTLVQFKNHRKSNKPFGITRRLQTYFIPPYLLKRKEECYNGKYLIHFFDYGNLKVFRLPMLNDNLRENHVVQNRHIIIESKDLGRSRVSIFYDRRVSMEISPTEQQTYDNLKLELAALSKAVSELIDYDMSVTGKTGGIFRKFCLNNKWLTLLTLEAEKLFEVERQSLMDTIADQSRIRDWIFAFIKADANQFGIKIRALFSNTVVENYALPQGAWTRARAFDLYRFYDVESLPDANDSNFHHRSSGSVRQSIVKERKFFDMPPINIYEHIMQDEFKMQDIHIQTANQINNFLLKFRNKLCPGVWMEFNKKFNDLQQFKHEIMSNVLGTNTKLNKIYDNMNIMLSLLDMETFEPGALLVPEWTKEEILERILTVDDSEIKAINRRKPKLIEEKKISGRILLWAPEFWKYALIVMMDGVVEKLWEEEIKKTPPMPEFMMKKQPHEYSLEEQKLLRDYEERLIILKEDRKKYLRILKENEKSTIELKTNYILKFNEKCGELALLKLKYDFAIRSIRLRMLNSKCRFLNLMQWKKRLALVKDDIKKVGTTADVYVSLVNFWDRSLDSIKQRLDALNARVQAIDRQFRTQFIPTVTALSANDLLKLYKKRPRPQQKALNSTLVCLEVATRVANKPQNFPLPKEAWDFLHALEGLETEQNSPTQLDLRHWETLVKLRRHRIDTELRVKANNYRLMDAQEALETIISSIDNLNDVKAGCSLEYERLSKEYFEIVQNQKLQLTLNMGQVEVKSTGSIEKLKQCLLMRVEDIEDINDLIKQAGTKKLKAMQKVAFFRRQVIYKEWEHKVYSANIEYLRYILNVIQKCKVTNEFLQIIRNWEKTRYSREQMKNSVGLIERVIGEKIEAYRRHLDVINAQIDTVKNQLDQMIQRNHRINKQIDDVKIDVAAATANRDVLIEEKRVREQNERMAKIKLHRNLIDGVRRDYAHILELTTILELQRLRTYPTLAPPPDECI